MPWTDLPPPEVRQHVTDMLAPADLMEFWSGKLTSAAELAEPIRISPEASRLRSVNVFDVEFSGADGDRIRGWFLTPAKSTEPLPCLVQYIGYGGGRGLSHQWTLWPSAGWATLVMDTRGQAMSDTPDPGLAGNPAVPGFITSGILDPQRHYYSRLFVDAVRAVESARELPQIDSERIAVAGASQGGGIAIAAAALSPHVRACMPDVAFFSDVIRAATLVATEPYSELADYLRAKPFELDRVRETLGYLDVAVLASLATCPALFSVGLMDDICPPSTVYAAFNAWSGPKEMLEYSFADHSGGGHQQVGKQLEWLTSHAAFTD